MGNIYLHQSEPEVALGYFDDADELIRTNGNIHNLLQALTKAALTQHNMMERNFLPPLR